MRLTAERLARMRQHQGRSLPDTCQVARNGSPTSDGRGGRTATRATVATIPCRVTANPPAFNEPVQEQRLLSAAQYRVTVAYNTDVRNGDRIVTGGRTLEVTGREAATAWSTALRLACVERAA